MKRIILIALVAFTGISLQADSKLDSMYSVWEDKSKHDSFRLQAYYYYVYNGILFNNPDSAFKLATEQLDYMKGKPYQGFKASFIGIQAISNGIKSNYPEALKYFHQCLEIYKKNKNESGIASTLSNIGLVHKYTGNYAIALKTLNRSLTIHEKHGNTRSIASALNNIGITYNSIGDNQNALKSLERCLQKYEEAKDTSGIASALLNIGNIHLDHGNTKKALENFQHSLAIHEKRGNKGGRAISMNNIGTIYTRMEEYVKAQDFLQRALNLRQEIGDKRGTAATLNNMADLFNQEGKYHLALDYNQRSLEMAEEIGDKKGTSHSLYNTGLIHSKQGLHRKAVIECKKARQLSKEIGSFDLQKNACTCLYKAYKAMGDGNEALKYHEEMQVLDDSLSSAETSRKLMQMEFTKQVFTDSIATAEREKQVQSQHQEELKRKNRTRNLLAAGGFRVLLLAGGIYSRLHYIRNAKNIIEKEKNRSESLLLNILPAEIAEELKEKGSADARDFDMVSIIFTDFKGFTATSEQLSAQDLISEINTCFKAFDGIIVQYGIEKIKTIGDAYMAAGGLPVPKDAAVKDTVIAALKMQAFITKRKKELDEMGKPAFEMRLGIHTGPVVAGIVGVQKFQYDIWGDTVNTASRMEQHGEVGKVNISQTTYELLKDDPGFTFENRGKIDTKRKGEIEMWYVSKAKA